VDGEFRRTADHEGHRDVVRLVIASEAKQSIS
jgi:hypothetical protein